MATEILTKRGRKKLLHDGFLYVFEKSNARGDVKFWICEFFGTRDIRCKGRLHTDIHDNVLKTIGVHACPSGAENTEVRKLTTMLKNRARGTMESHSVLRSVTLDNVPTPVLARFPDKNATKKVVKRVRQADNVPCATPESVEQLQIPLDYRQYQRSENINGEDRTNNFAEAAHRRLQRAFSCSHPSIWRFIETLKKEQKLRDAEMALCVAGHDPPPKARRYQEADRRILTLTRNYRPLNIGNPGHVNVDNFNPQNIIDFLAGISHNYAMDP